MPVREIASIVWYEQGDHIEVIYVDTNAQHLFGSEEIAIVLARDSGLNSVPTPSGTRQWVRIP
jgi:hypothetical protein